MNTDSKTANRVGQAKTIHTAILVVGYLRARCTYLGSSILPGEVYYKQNTPVDESEVIWPFHIMVDGRLSLADAHELVTNCRAFVAGRGEAWA